MQKEFIPYQQALALKELGFDEPFNPFDTFYYRNGDLCEANKDAVEYFNSFNDEVVLAPLYQQAFRWFRDKYNLDYSILPESTSGHRLSTRTFNIVIYRYYMNINVQAEILRIDGEIARYISKEEAELACLNKLIETIKNK